MPPQPGRGIIRPSGRVGVRGTTGRVAIAGASGQTCNCCGIGLACTGCGTGDNLAARCRITFSGIFHQNTGCACGGWSLEWLFNINTSYLLTRTGGGLNNCEFDLPTGTVALQRRRCTTGQIDGTHMLGISADFAREIGPPATYSVGIVMQLVGFGIVFRHGVSGVPYSSCVLNHQPFHEDENNPPSGNPSCDLFRRVSSAVATVSFEL